GIRDFHVTGVQTCALPIFLQVITSYSRIPAITTVATDITISPPGVGSPTAITHPAVRNLRQESPKLSSSSPHDFNLGDRRLVFESESIWPSFSNFWISCKP